ncbi:MAG: rRNA maturation RNase YbeY [Actinomycetota bacterium]|jgi:probable rRNA maturation factor
MDVFLANEQGLPVDEARLCALARHALGTESVDEEAELSILVVDREHMRRLNARFASNDYATDVLAFPMLEGDEDSTTIGDVVLCPDVARDNVAELDHSLARELDVLIVHGTLHLLGYDHQNATDKERMDGRVTDVLDDFNRVGSRP